LVKYLRVVAVLTADALLVGPRGRGLCLAVAELLNDEVRGAAWLARGSAGSQPLVRVLEATDPTPVHAWRDPLLFLEPMDRCVSEAMYWQQPHDEDVVAADPAVVAALQPIAAAIAAAPGSAWWSTPLDAAALRYTSRYDDDHPPASPTLTGARQRLHRWHAGVLKEERAAASRHRDDPSARYSAQWWSTPAMAALVTTTRALPELGSIQLAWEEDSFGQPRAWVWPLTTTRAPRVWEINRPQQWVSLVERYPLEVTNARRHDWYRSTGRDGSWRIPDWSAVAEDWDGVHVSVAGYLTTATRALPVAGGSAATVLAGVNPDQTWWLADVLTTSTDRPEIWQNTDDPDLAWHLVSQ
jgi:hypothetical protein